MGHRRLLPSRVIHSRWTLRLLERLLLLLWLLVIAVLGLLLRSLGVLVKLLLVSQRRAGLALGVQSQAPLAYPVADALAAQLLGVAAVAGLAVQTVGHVRRAGQRQRGAVVVREEEKSKLGFGLEFWAHMRCQQWPRHAHA